MSDVVIIGAGFSHAISQTMPVTDQLGQDAIARADLEDDPRVPSQPFGPGFTFETWLSLLAEDQPYLSETRVKANEALFYQVRDAMYYVLVTAEQSVVGAAAPGWLYDLLSVFHHRQPTVLSFNYDTLLETAVRSHSLGSTSGQKVDVTDVLFDLPPLPPRQLGSGVIQSTFRLLKLHGSLDWWSVPDDWTGATLNRVESGSTFGNLAVLQDDARRRFLPGRAPFIVPPTSTKSHYFKNPIIRELWSSAYSALRGASKIALVGYSLPEADLVTLGMLESAVRRRTPEFLIVNPHPEGPRQRLIGLGVNAEQISILDGANCVADFSEQKVTEASVDVLAGIGALDADKCADTALLVSWATHPLMAGPSTRRVEKVTTLENGMVELTIDRKAPLVTATEARFDAEGKPSGDRVASLRDLILAARGGGRLLVASGEGLVRVPIVGTWYELRETGASHRWLSFAPAGLQPPVSSSLATSGTQLTPPRRD